MTHDPTQLDVVGIGAGPTNLALAAALADEESPLTRVFLERSPEVRWHPGMLLEGATIQLNVLKDLVTPRNPTSIYSFLNYLRHRGRLFEFLNLRDLYPTRHEFVDYLRWVAGELAPAIEYGHEVTSVEPLRGVDGVVRAFVVRARDTNGAEHALVTKNVVVGTGGAPIAPPGVELIGSPKILHPSRYLDDLAARFPDPAAPYRFVIVGGGQSAGEIFLDLLSRYRNADVTATVRGIGYRPTNDSEFVNEVFFPEKVDLFYSLPAEKRAVLFDAVYDVNYGVVDAPLIRRIYRTLYDMRAMGVERARLRPFLHLERVESMEGRRSDAGAPVRLTFRDRLSDEPVSLEADGAVIATGYAWRRDHPVLAGVRDLVVTDESGEPILERDYRVRTVPGVDGAIYMPGFGERTHGVAEPVMSLLANRAGDVAASIAQREASTAASVPRVTPRPSAPSRTAASRTTTPSRATGATSHEVTVAEPWPAHLEPTRS